MATTIATSTFAQPIVRAGSRAVIKLGNGNLLVVYHDGAVGFKSKEASAEANLPGASAVAIAATTDSNDPRSYCLWPDGVFLSEIGSVSGASNYQTYSAGAWTAHAAPPIWGNFDQVSGFKSGTSYYFTSWGNFNAEFDAHVATSFGGAFTGLGQNNIANSDGMDNQGLVALPWKSLILNLMLDSGRNLQWYAKDTLAGVSGGNFNAATSLEVLPAGAPYQNNLAGVTDSNGNAWMAYQDNTGIQLRMITAAGTTWTAKTAVTAQASDKYPALFQDTAGAVYAFWIDGVDGKVKTQKATVSAGAISLSGTVTTVATPAATANYLSVIESDATNAYLMWVEGASSPYNIVLHTFPLSSIVGKSVSESASGSEAIDPGTITPALSDSATGTDFGGLLGAPDTAVGADALSLGTVTFPLADTASGTEALNVNKGSPVAVMTADQASQTRFGRNIVRDGSGRALMCLTPVYSDGGATQFGPAAFLYTAAAPYQSWSQGNSPGTLLNGIKLNETAVCNPSVYYDSVNGDLFIVGGNNQNDGLPPSNYNDVIWGYATSFTGAVTTTNLGQTWDNGPVTAAVIVPGSHNIWAAGPMLTPGCGWGAAAGGQNIMLWMLSGGETGTYVNNGDGGSGHATNGPVAPVNNPASMQTELQYTSGSPATIYCFFNDSTGVLRYVTWADTAAIPNNVHAASTSYSSPVASGTLAVSAEQFSTARDSSDGLHVVVANGSGIQYVYKPSGGAWTAPVTISNNVGDSYPRVTIFGNTQVVITWIQATGVANKQNVVYSWSPISSTPIFSAVQSIYTDAGTNNAQYTTAESNSPDGTTFMVGWVQGTANPFTVYTMQVTPTFTVQPSPTETATGTEAVALANTVAAPVPDAGSGTQAATLGTITPAVSETAGGTEGASTLIGPQPLEPATGADVAALGTIAPAVAETAAGTEAAALPGTIAAAIPETATGSEAAALAQAVTPAVAESNASATDAPAIGTISPAPTDTAGGGEAAALLIQPAISETAGGTESAGLAATVTIGAAETAAGTENVNLGGTSTPTIPDSATGSEAAALASTVTLGAADTATGGDVAALSTIGAPVFDTIGTGGETFTAQTQLAQGDSGTGSEATALAATVTLSTAPDLATGTDTPTVSQGSGVIMLPDAASAAEALSLGTQSATAADSATGSESAPTLATVGLTQPETGAAVDVPALGTIAPAPTDSSAAGAEAVAVPATIAAAIPEGGAGAEVASLATVTPVLAETAGGSESTSIIAGGIHTIALPDTATGSDTAVQAQQWRGPKITATRYGGPLS